MEQKIELNILRQEVERLKIIISEIKDKYPARKKRPISMIDHLFDKDQYTTGEITETSERDAETQYKREEKQKREENIPYKDIWQRGKIQTYSKTVKENNNVKKHMTNIGRSKVYYNKSIPDT